MRIERKFTEAGKSAYDSVAFRTATSEIRNPDGSVVFRLADIQVPEQFSQVASDVLAQKYFRKAGVPKHLKKVEENAVPSWLWRSEADKDALAKLPKDEAVRLGKSMRVRSSTVSPAPGPIGAGRVVTSPRKTMRSPSATNSPTCSPPSASRRTRRNGSTPACTGPTASTAPARAISMSTPSPASSSSPSRPMSIRSRMPASSSPSRTTSSTRAASWTSGCARRACSNMAQVQARTSRICAARAKSSRAAAVRPA